MTAESQTARLQESSTISNVVNSNSAGSNGSQKTPTALSQQLTLTGVCANCGAHQTFLNQAAASLQQSQLQTAHLHQAHVPAKNQHQVHVHRQPQQQSKRQMLAASRLSGSEAQLNSASGAGRQVANCQAISASQQQAQHGTISCPGTQLMQKAAASDKQQSEAGDTAMQAGRSSIVVSSSASPLAVNRQGGTQAKVVHSKIGANCTEFAQQQQASVKRMLSDGHLREANTCSNWSNLQQGQLPAGYCWTNAQLEQKPSSKKAHLPSGTNNAKGSANCSKQMSSLSRLNEIANSTTSSERGQCNLESISSLANDSLANTTSQEMTPCGLAKAASVTRQSAGDTTPAERRCGAGPRRDQTGSCPQPDYALASGTKGGSDSMLWNQSVYSIDYCSDCCPSYCHCSCPACSSSIGGDEPIDSGAICVHAATSSHQTADTELDEYDTMLCDSFVIHDQDPLELQPMEQPIRHATERDQKSGHCDATKLVHQQHDANGEADELGEFDSSLIDTCASRSQTIEMKTIAGDGACRPNARQTATEMNTSDEDATTRWSQASSKPVTYALQAATSSVLSAACVVSPLLVAGQDPKHSSEDQSRKKQQYSTSSNRDKISEKKTHTIGRKDDIQGQQTYQQRTSQSTISSVDRPAAGAIQASIEMAKSTIEAKRQQRESGSSCFSSYHDDYELNYGLVQSDSEDFYRGHDHQQASFDKLAGHREDNELQRTCSVSRSANRMSTSHYQGHDHGDCDINANNDEDVDGDDDDDDFGHDGRLSLSRQASHTTSGRRRKHHGGSSRSKSKRSMELAIDEHRINSMALVAATLSTGGAIVESSSMGQSQQPIQKAPSGTVSRSQQSKSTLTQAKIVSGDQTSSASSSAGGDSADGHISCLTTL